MQQQAALTKSTRHMADRAERDASAGPNGVAIQPPTYGIDVMDSAPIQAVAADTSRGLGVASMSENRTGLPDRLKSGIEQLSGLSMDDVKVHYNSSKPAQFNALAYAQGSDIHIGPGQEQHLPHEAWHVTQQKQGRVTPTIQAQGVSINDDDGLENEAEVMGAKAAVWQQSKPFGSDPIDCDIVDVQRRQIEALQLHIPIRHLQPARVAISDSPALDHEVKKLGEKSAHDSQTPPILQLFGEPPLQLQGGEWWQEFKQTLSYTWAGMRGVRLSKSILSIGLSILAVGNAVYDGIENGYQPANISTTVFPAVAAIAWMWHMLEKAYEEGQPIQKLVQDIEANVSRLEDMAKREPLVGDDNDVSSAIKNLRSAINTITQEVSFESRRQISFRSDESVGGGDGGNDNNSGNFEGFQVQG